MHRRLRPFGATEPAQSRRPPGGRARRDTLEAQQPAAELSQPDTDLSKIAVEPPPGGLSSEAASEKRPPGWSELARIESDLKAKKASLNEEISQLSRS